MKLVRGFLTGTIGAVGGEAVGIEAVAGVVGVRGHNYLTLSQQA